MDPFLFSLCKFNYDVMKIFSKLLIKSHRLSLPCEGSLVTPININVSPLHHTFTIISVDLIARYRGNLMNPSYNHFEPLTLAGS